VRVHASADDVGYHGLAPGNFLDDIGDHSDRCADLDGITSLEDRSESELRMRNTQQQNQNYQRPPESSKNSFRRIPVHDLSPFFDRGSLQADPLKLRAREYKHAIN
jgi:hypothetical protein